MTTDKGEQNMTDSEISERCAVDVMRWRCSETFGKEIRQWGNLSCWRDGNKFMFRKRDWSPATRIEQAFMLVDKMAQLGWWKFSVYRDSDRDKRGIEYGPTPHEVNRFVCVLAESDGSLNNWQAVERGDTPQKAICLTTLAALGAVERRE